MSLLPEDLYKRRHFGTPESLMIMVVNYVVLAVDIEWFAMCSKISWGFYAVLAVLAFYNYYTINKNRDEFTKQVTIGYIASLAGLVLMFILFRLKAQPC